MRKLTSTEKALAEFIERLQGLCNEGYREIFRAKTFHLLIVRLVHNNGKRITLQCDFDELSITQISNGKQTYKHTLCEH